MDVLGWNRVLKRQAQLEDKNYRISYDVERDYVEDVLNENVINGLSHASEEGGRIALYVVDGWTEASFELVKSICKDFGYECYMDE